MHIRHTDTAGALGGVHLVAGDAAAVINMLAQDCVAGVGTDIEHHVAVHFHAILVHHTDCSVYLIAKFIEMNQVVACSVVRGVASHIHAYLATIELAVGYRHRIRAIGINQCFTRSIHGVAVHKLAVFEQAVGASFAQLGQHCAAVVGVSALNETDIAEMNAIGIFKVDQGGDPGDCIGATVRTAECHHRRCCSRLKGHPLGGRCTGDIGELGYTIIAGRQFDGQGTIDTTTA